MRPRGNGNFVGNAVLCVGLLVGAGFILDRLDVFPDLPDCAKSNPLHCIGISGSPENPFDDETDEYGSRVRGGITGIRITQNTWPLFEREVEFSPLEITHEGDLAYSSDEVYKVSTSLVGNAIAIVDDTGPTEQIYIMGIDDKGTEDTTDDTVEPLDIRKMGMLSEYGTNTRTFASSQREVEDGYNDCVANLYAGGLENIDYTGCAITNSADAEHMPAPEVINNVRAQYLQFDGSVVDLMHAASNVLFAHKNAATGWKQVYPETVLAIQLIARGMVQHVHDVLGVDMANIHPIIAKDPNTGRYIEWNPNDRPDMTEVERMSDGAYDAKGVSVSEFGIDGSYDNSKFGQELAASLIKNKNMPAEMLDPKWYEGLVFPDVTVPIVVLGTRFNASGDVISPLPPQAPIPTTTIG